MERRDQVIVLLVLAGAGYAGYRNWDAISARLGLNDLSPRHVKAISLAKRAFTFERTRNNSLVVDDWIRREEVTVDGDPWHAQALQGERFLVTCRMRRDDENDERRFVVDVGSGDCRPLEADEPAPR